MSDKVVTDYKAYTPTHLYTQRVSLIVTKRCTLKCKLCGALAPYIESYHPSTDFLQWEIDSFFDIVDKTGIIDISGGEPLLRGVENDFALGDVLEYLVKKYADRFDRLRIFTNATVMPSEKLLKCIRYVSEVKPFSITVDNYGEHSPKVRAIAEKLLAAQVDFIVRDYHADIHCGGWVDQRDIAYKNHDLNDDIALFGKCAIPQKLGCCLELLNGIISPCSVAAARYICGDTDKTGDDIIDLNDDKIKMRQKLRGLLTAKMFESCRYCDGGLSDDARRFVPAEQATMEDIVSFKERHKMIM